MPEAEIANTCQRLTEEEFELLQSVGNGSMPEAVKRVAEYLNSRGPGDLFDNDIKEFSWNRRIQYHTEDRKVIDRWRLARRHHLKLTFKDVLIGVARLLNK